MGPAMCDHRGPFGGDLVCTRDDHADNGHTYEAAWAPDGTHDDTTEDA